MATTLKEYFRESIREYLPIIKQAIEEGSTSEPTTYDEEFTPSDNSNDCDGYLIQNMNNVNDERVVILNTPTYDGWFSYKYYFKVSFDCRIQIDLTAQHSSTAWKAGAACGDQDYWRTEDISSDSHTVDLNAGQYFYINAWNWDSGGWNLELAFTVSQR